MTELPGDDEDRRFRQERAEAERLRRDRESTRELLASLRRASAEAAAAAEAAAEAENRRRESE